MNEPNPKQQYGDRKVKLQLVPLSADIAIAAGLEEGAQKYSPWNWRDQPVEAMTYVGAALRHIKAWVEGEEDDPDSEMGKHHLDGAIASLAILIDARATGSLLDNRPGKKCEGALERLKRGSRRMVEVVETPGVECSEVAPAAITMPPCADEPPPPTEAESFPGPDWSQAPEWAEWWCFDKDGWSKWSSTEPERIDTVWICKHPKGKSYFCGDTHRAYSERWRDSLRRRPQ